MAYCLPDTMSYCRTEDGLIFLDVDGDRYFRLNPVLEEALVDCLLGRTVEQATADILVRRGVLLRDAPQRDQRTAHQLVSPQRSVVEGTRASVAVSAMATLEVASIVLLLHRRLRRRPLKDVLQWVATKRRLAVPMPPDGSSTDEGRLAESSTCFRRLRPLIPIEPICLLDSLALTVFLARRKLHASIVFGVTSAPFTAHCWVQSGDLVLNDTVGHANAYTVVRVA
ncbi:lasso peptide biosynthesis B2 protein [Luteimonas sp. WGS1318]|uniref:lasso peptide biosynthesis B2 protein n=1 Tax=Luteimonas sp. WGS1318 TaxID=3366815 RepID=UPI00372D329C